MPCFVVLPNEVSKNNSQFEVKFHQALWIEFITYLWNHCRCLRWRIIRVRYGFFSSQARKTKITLFITILNIFCTVNMISYHILNIFHALLSFLERRLIFFGWICLISFSSSAHVSGKMSTWLLETLVINADIHFLICWLSYAAEAR